MNIRRKLSWLLHCSDRLQVCIDFDNHTQKLKSRHIFRTLLIPLGLLNVLRLKSREKTVDKFKYNLSVVAIVKNEAPYISEWITYHLSAGVNHFYIYDNDSSDNTAEVLQKFSEVVTYSKIWGSVRQLDAYNDALNKYSQETEYLAFIDADEFLFSPIGEHQLFPIIDKKFMNNPKIGGFVINWMVFGSSGYIHKPSGLVTDNYLHRSDASFSKNRLVKTICNPRKTFYFSVSHAANYLPGYFAVDEENRRTPWTKTSSNVSSTIRINHYYSKSKDEFLLKRSRGSAEVTGFRDLSEFDEHDRNEVYDASMRVYNLEHGLSQK